MIIALCLYLSQFVINPSHIVIPVAICLWSTMRILALYQCWRSKLNHSQKIITKCDRIITNRDRLVHYKVRWTVITNCDSFFYYKVRYGLLQIATGITKCDDYYKLRQNDCKSWVWVRVDVVSQSCPILSANCRYDLRLFRLFRSDSSGMDKIFIGNMSFIQLCCESHATVGKSTGNKQYLT